MNAGFVPRVRPAKITPGMEAVPLLYDRGTVAKVWCICFVEAGNCIKRKW